MILFQEAYKKVLDNTFDFGDEQVAILESMGRVLAENILADRDFPPFDRATKDGIAINYFAIEDGCTRFKIEGVAAAGTPQQRLSNVNNCLEIMTGAVVPENADSVIMYEHLTIQEGWATVTKLPNKGQDIHYQGSDSPKGAVLLEPGKQISAGAINVLASVGKSEVLVKKLPKVTVISTGNELVEVHERPLPHQIRKSNSLSLKAALQKQGINAALIHLTDEKEMISKAIRKVMETSDVLMLSGGVSKGKFDFVPEVLEELGVEKVFHRVAQRPGKPFWFGLHQESRTTIFSFPGNPVSTFANYHIYFLPWLYKALRVDYPERKVVLAEPIQNKTDLTLFKQVRTFWKNGSLHAHLIVENGSGDLTSLANLNGFIRLEPRDGIYDKGELVPFIKT
ncbi:molybdopterin molybdotransferase MoeA [Maribacter algicola]|uniref:Molybdopterin molybdotransferase MoeA n=1 Tax=Meishania litoralis TaxID=3434685 RepID=A0ACC7LMM2_9FLAO